MLTRDFHYELPPSAIAQTPLGRRSRCRLAVVDRATGLATHTRFDRIGEWLRPGDLLVLNDSRVLPARIPCRRGSGGAVEVFLLDPLAPGDRLSALLRPASKIRLGESLRPEREGGGGFTLTQRGDDGAAILRWSGDGPWTAGLLERLGLPPLPPYIRRGRIPDRHRTRRDQAAYQTVYAQPAGSVAAPTAGLHFTRGLLKNLRSAGIETAFVTLHVGAGTFQPVKTRTLEEHAIHAEQCVVPAETARAIQVARARGGRIVAVGTTALRTLESAALENGGFRGDWFETRLFIQPGYRFRAATALLTNFHQPESTLLPLVAAFWDRTSLLQLYLDCLGSGYRFLSYGDACLFL